MTPDEAFRSLMSGNDRFAANRFTSVELPPKLGERGGVKST